MHRLSRLVVAAAILMLGAAIAPSLALPSQPFNWQMYAGAYQQPEPVIVSDLAFAPNVILVPVGTTVRWTNNGTVNHTITSDTPLFDSGALAPGASFEYRFDTPGTFTYHCTLHPTLTGKVIVTGQVFDIYLPLVSKNVP